MPKIVFIAREIDPPQARGIPSGKSQVLSRLISSANIAPEDYTIIPIATAASPNTFDFDYLGPKSTAIPDYRSVSQGKYFRADKAHVLDAMWAKIEAAAPNLIVPLGATAIWATCKKSGINRYRGAPMMDFSSRYKVLPTHSPGEILRQWSLRPVVALDLQKALRESAFPELRRPRREIWCNPTLADIEYFVKTYIAPAKSVSCDIETKAGTITEVGYAPDKSRAIVIPFYSRETADGNYWKTLREEVAAWRIIKSLNARKPLFGQNFAYDMQYFIRANGVACKKFCDDTMLMHHALQPEMQKSLGFLGTLYTDEPSWKFMRTDHSTLKGED